MISESVAFLVADGQACVYDAEHFFDGYRTTATTRCAAWRRRRAAGAETVVLCDTNGSSLPAPGREAARGVLDGAGRRARSGSTVTTTPACGVANTLAAVLAGATQVQGTMNGCGERPATPTSSRSSPTCS